MTIRSSAPSRRVRSTGSNELDVHGVNGLGVGLSRGRSSKIRSRCGFCLACLNRLNVTSRQRRFTSQPGIALGLLNAYLKRCVRRAGEDETRAGDGYRSRQQAVAAVAREHVLIPKLLRIPTNGASSS